jgi:hypothetical protein
VHDVGTDVHTAELPLAIATRTFAIAMHTFATNRCVDVSRVVRMRAEPCGRVAPAAVRISRVQRLTRGVAEYA